MDFIMKIGFMPVQSIRSVMPVAEAAFPTRWAEFRIFGFEWPGAAGEADKESAVALRLGHSPNPLVRIHSQCLTGDVFGSLRCDCRAQLELALEMIAAEKAGILIYEDKEGRGIGLMNKLRAYQLQDQGADTVEANQKLGLAVDARGYALPAAILHYFGVQRLRLLSNNPEKIQALEQAGIQVTERIACEPAVAPQARHYLRTKRQKLGHWISRPES